jgi:hypothetical protein
MEGIRNSTNKKDLNFNLYNIDEKEEDNNDLSRGTIILRAEEQNNENILRVQAKSNDNFLIRNTTYARNYDEIGGDQSDDEGLNIVDDSEEVAFVDNAEQLRRTKSRVSFYEGRPKCEQDILKLECPLYRCSRNTIVTKKSKVRSTSNIYNLTSKISNSNFEDSNQNSKNKFKKLYTNDSFLSNSPSKLILI